MKKYLSVSLNYPFPHKETKPSLQTLSPHYLAQRTDSTDTEPRLHTNYPAQLNLNCLVTTRSIREGGYVVAVDRDLLALSRINQSEALQKQSTLPEVLLLCENTNLGI